LYNPTLLIKIIDLDINNWCST